MNAITLWQPWAHMVAWHGKRVENRGRLLKKTRRRPVLGAPIAITAATTARPTKADEIEALEDVNRDFNLQVKTSMLARGAVVCTARVIGFALPSGEIEALPGSREACLAARNSDWYSGPAGYILGDVVPLLAPVACRGAQGLWQLSPEAIELVTFEEELMAALCRARSGWTPEPGQVPIAEELVDRDLLIWHGIGNSAQITSSGVARSERAQLGARLIAELMRRR